jgi:hypothetical protein
MENVYDKEGNYCYSKCSCGYALNLCTKNNKILYHCNSCGREFMPESAPNMRHNNLIREKCA